MIYVTIIVVIVCVAFTTLYNRLMHAVNLVQEAWSGIDVQLIRRHDLIPNLVEAVKGYSKHEHALFVEIAKMRNEIASTDSIGKRSAAENALSQGIRSLLSITEAQPELRASENFLDLQKNLTDTEDQIQFARRYYNGTVRDLNTMIEIFPSNIIAKLFNLQKQEFFDAELASEHGLTEE